MSSHGPIVRAKERCVPHARLFKKARFGVAFATVAAMGLISACSSSSDTETASETPISTETSAEAEAPESSGNQEVTAAQAIVDQFTQAPTTIVQNTPLSGPFPGVGATHVFLQCELPQCKNIGDGVRAADKAVGWISKTIPYNTADPATLSSAMMQALDFNPAVVTPTGFPQAVWGSPEILAAYKEAGVIIVPVSVANLEISETVPGGAATALDYNLGGELIGNWFIADSNAQGHALVLDVPAYEVMKAHGDSVKATVAAGCVGCKVTALDITLPQLGAGETNPAIVAAIQKDPTIKYVLATNGAFIGGLRAALDAADLNDVKIAGGSATINNYQGLIDGTESAWAAEAIFQRGWIVADIAARALLGMDVPDGDGGGVQMLLTAENVDNPPTESLDKPVDYEAQFKTLWGLN